MECPRNRPGIVKPKALRKVVLKPSGGCGFVRAPSKSLYSKRERCSAMNTLGQKCEFPPGCEGQDMDLPPATALESLIPFLCNEDSEIQEQAMLETEMRLRSHSFVPAPSDESEKEADKNEFRNSYPLMNNVLVIPERPTNPMCRDSAFAFDTATSCVSEARIFQGEMLRAPYNDFMGAQSPPCVFN